ncbi:MAG TPA: DUF4783 domain-containing protein [Mucilaginibacter sp.]|jgi:hypothetical protein|nr:DUF4783 domain-containing protein [Mucilaginibacter sp.]
MKILYAFLLLVLTTAFQGAGDDIDRTAQLIGAGNIAELSKDFAPVVDLTIMDNESESSSAITKNLLTDFLDKHEPRSMRILHRITSSPKFHYGVILITTEDGVYRVAFSLKNNNGHFQLTELRIEAGKEN